MKFILTKKDRGFALLFSVLISSLLLTIGLSIFGIALKELAISTAARQSIHAFFAADSGRECLLYWDTKRGAIPTLIDENTVGNIECNGQVLPFSIVEGSSYNSTLGPKTSSFSAVSVVDDGPYFDAVIKKYRNNFSETNIMTDLTARGYDSPAGNRVERAIEQNY